MNLAFQCMHAYLMLLLYPTFSQFPSPPKHKMKALPVQPNSFKINITNKTPCNLYTRIPVGFCPVLYDLECIFSYLKLTYISHPACAQWAKIIGEKVQFREATLFADKGQNQRVFLNIFQWSSLEGACSSEVFFFQKNL